MNSPEFVIRLHTSSAQAAVIDELFATTDLQYALWDDADDDRAIFSVYAADAVDAEAVRAALLASLASWADLLDDAWQVADTEALPREDWAESWKRHFTCTRLSPRIAVTPSWERHLAPHVPAIVEIDPGMAFGTGLHGTTRACLELLDVATPALPPNALAIDMGCGTGILAIAAVKLGWNPVHAIDLDDEAVRATRENLAKNHVRAHVATGDLSVWQPPAKSPMVMVNILAPLLIAHADNVLSWAQPGANLILSGILTEQFEDVCAAYADRGCTLADSRTIDKWTSGLFHCPGKSAQP